MSYWKEEANRRREIRQSVPCEDTTPFRKQRKSASKPFYLEQRLRPGEKAWCWDKQYEDNEWRKSHDKYKTLKAAQEACKNFNRSDKCYYSRYEFRVASECMLVIGD